MNRRIDGIAGCQDRSTGIAEVQKQQEREGKPAIHYYECMDNSITVLTDT